MQTKLHTKPLLPRKIRKEAVKNDGIERTTVSFYRYVNISNPVKFGEKLLNNLNSLGCLGRIYVAKEGINAQMNVPTKNMNLFQSYLESESLLSNMPLKIAVEEGDVPSFYKLTIKIRDKIVADGLNDDTFDPSNTGDYLTAEDINSYVDDENAVIVDMRNAYESEIGHFENAITPDVDTFREELEKIPEILKIHKNKKIALYCTGGIRCEKASAWLKHLGFKNVKHLKDGIIDYAHQVKAQNLPNRFKGKNFVFDERLGEKISNEIISTCHLCKKRKSDTHYHCTNQICHRLYIGCETCVTKKLGYCSYYCNLTDRLPKKIKPYYARWYNKITRGPLYKKRRLRS